MYYNVFYKIFINISEVIQLTTISIRIDEIEKQLLQEYAEENDTTVSWVVRKAIKEFLASHDYL